MNPEEIRIKMEPTDWSSNTMEPESSDGTSSYSQINQQDTAVNGNPEAIREGFLKAIKELMIDFDDDDMDLHYFTNRQNCSIIITKRNHAYYPLEFVLELQESNQDFANAQEFCELNVTLRPVRVVISLDTFKASLQLHHRELKCISNAFYFNEYANLWELSEDLFEMVEKVKYIDSGFYQICCGFTKDEVAPRINSNCLKKLTYPFNKFISIRCEGIYKLYTNATSSLAQELPRCEMCKKWLFAAASILTNKTIRERKSKEKNCATSELEEGDT